jgi:hypothetical protein
MKRFVAAEPRIRVGRARRRGTRREARERERRNDATPRTLPKTGDKVVRTRIDGRRHGGGHVATTIVCVSMALAGQSSTIA